MLSADIVKTDSIRTIPIGPEVIDILKNIVPDIEGALFSGVTVSYVDKVWRQARTHLKITDKNFIPHAIRHTFATDLLRQGEEVVKVKECLGHSDFKTTMIYIHLQFEDLRASMQRRTRL